MYSVVSSTPTYVCIRKDLFAVKQAAVEETTGSCSSDTRLEFAELDGSADLSQESIHRVSFEGQTEVSATRSAGNTPYRRNSSRRQDRKLRRRKNRAVKTSQVNSSLLESKQQDSVLSFSSESQTLMSEGDVFAQAPRNTSMIGETHPNHENSVDPLHSSCHEATSTTAGCPETLNLSQLAEFSDADLSAPGFKCRRHIRQRAAAARRVSHAGNTPNRPSAQQKRSWDPSETQSKRWCDSPGSVDSSTDDVCYSRAPRVAKERERHQLAQRHISTPCKESSHQREQNSPVNPALHSPPRSRMFLPDSVKENILNLKYRNRSWSNMSSSNESLVLGHRDNIAA